MQFMGCLYVGEKLSSAEYKIVEKVHKGKVVQNLFLIVFSSNPDNMLDIIPEKEITQKHYPKDGLRIVGIADGKKEALGLVQRMIHESLAETGSADVRGFLQAKWEGQACR